MKEFDDQLARAEKGDEIVYHRGFHCLDPRVDHPKRNEAAKAAWQAYLRGDVVLYQRRIREGLLHYCAKVIV